MIKIIDLDSLSKFLTADNGVVFVVSVGGDKVGLTAAEVAELVKQKITASLPASATQSQAARAGAKKSARGAKSAAGDSSQEGGGLDSSGAAEDGESTPDREDSPRHGHSGVDLSSQDVDVLAGTAVTGGHSHLNLPNLSPSSFDAS